MMGCEFCNCVRAARSELASLSQSSTTPKHLGGRRLVKTNRSLSYHLKEPSNPKMIDFGGVQRLLERFPNVRLGPKIVDLIRLYSLDRPSDGFVLDELQ